jgi:hypothetical protein
MSAAILQSPALPNPDPFSAPRLNVRQTLDLLRTSRASLYRFTRHGIRGVRLRATKIGGKTFFRLDDLIRWIEATQPDANGVSAHAADVQGRGA